MFSSLFVALPSLIHYLWCLPFLPAWTAYRSTASFLFLCLDLYVKLRLSTAGQRRLYVLV